MPDKIISFNQTVDNGLTSEKDFFQEYASEEDSYNFLFKRYGLLCGTFLLKDNSKTYNLSTGQAKHLLPEFFSLHPLLFNHLKGDKKIQLIRTLMRAYAIIKFADNIVFPITGDNRATYNLGTTYSPELVVFILDCYMKAVVNCLSSGNEKSNPDDFALEKTVFGNYYQQYIYKESGIAFSEKISSQFTFTQLQNNKYFKEYVIISKKQDVSYLEIYNLFHSKTPFPVLAFLAIYKSFEENDMLTDKDLWPCFFPVRYESPGEPPIIVTAVCICDNSINYKYLLMEELTRTIKDTYLDNKKIEERKRNYIKKLHLRAITTRPPTEL